MFISCTANSQGQAAPMFMILTQMRLRFWVQGNECYSLDTVFHNDAQVEMPIWNLWSPDFHHIHQSFIIEGDGEWLQLMDDCKT